MNSRVLGKKFYQDIELCRYRMINKYLKSINSKDTLNKDLLDANKYIDIFDMLVPNCKDR